MVDRLNGAPGKRFPPWLAIRPRQHPLMLGITLFDRSWIPRTFRLSAFAAWPSCLAMASAPPHDGPIANCGPDRGFHVPHRQDASGGLASRRRERGSISTGPLIPVERGSSKDISTPFVPLPITTLPPGLHTRSPQLQRFSAEIVGGAPLSVSTLW
jgi:hypothetical protein